MKVVLTIGKSILFKEAIRIELLFAFGAVEAVRMPSFAHCG